MVLYEIGGRYACSYRHGCAKSRYRRAQSGAQRAKQSKATLLRLFAETKMRKEGKFSFSWRVEFETASYLLAHLLLLLLF